MNKLITIYCEGKRGSHDFDILEKLLPYPKITIQPVGSKRGGQSAVQVHESMKKSDFYLFFRDRDFDKPIPENHVLESMANNYVYLGYLNTIENYLFNAEIFFRFVDEKNLKNQYNINSIEDARNLFIRAATEIKYYQAVRHTMGKMRTGETSFGTKWVNKSGILPENLDLEYCKRQAFEKINNAKDIANTWTYERFNEICNEFLAQFNENFIANFHFLIYFQGKDFAKSLVNILPQGFSIKAYYRFAKKHFDYTQFPDLVALHDILKAEYEK